MDAGMDRQVKKGHAVASGRILFVCSGNICRSPAAASVFNALAEEAGAPWRADSAGTGGWHVGEPMDPRMREALARAGFAPPRHRARQVRAHELGGYDIVLAMGKDHLAALRAMASAAPKGERPEIAMFLSYPALEGPEVEDPYYQGHAAFDRVVGVVVAGVRRLLGHLAVRTP
jgi:protein-tyrosine phosphatase